MSAKRSYGTGALFEKHGCWYGRGGCPTDEHGCWYGRGGCPTDAGSHDGPGRCDGRAATRG